MACTRRGLGRDESRQIVAAMQWDGYACSNQNRSFVAALRWDASVWSNRDTSK